MKPRGFSEYISAKRELDKWLKKNYPRGKKLLWNMGPLKGRLCQIYNSFWEVEDYSKGPQFFVYVTVQTFKKKAPGEFIDDNTSYHRRYRNVDCCFKEVEESDLKSYKWDTREYVKL